MPENEQVTTVAELEAMTPAERQANFEASAVTDPAQLPDGYLDRLRTRLAPVVAQRDAEQSKLRRS